MDASRGAADPVRFVEPFRTVFYTPHYLAHGLGLFAAEGLEARLETVTAPNGVARALSSDHADVGVSGPIRALAAADRGESPLMCVAGLNSRAGFFLLARKPVADFEWRDLVGRRVLVFAEAPTPRLCLEYLLERHGVNLAAVDLVADLPSDHAIDAFCGGRADYLLQGQPVTESLLARREAHLAAALGPALGPVAFSAYLVTPRALARSPVIGGVVRALGRAQRWLHAHTPAEAAAAVAWAFPDLSPPVLTAAIRRYLATRTWPAEPTVRRSELDSLQEILLLRGFIRRSHAFDAIVDSTWAEAAVRALAAETAAVPATAASGPVAPGLPAPGPGSSGSPGPAGPGR